jgi:hypothetical protein
VAIEQPQSKDPERKTIPLWIGFGFTAVWGLFFVIYLCRNFEHVRTLQANNLGDFFGGFFAPLAFLWLLVATLLQRQELELQREELRETRQVMKLQKEEMQLQREEMKRAADENREQTKIMTENLTQEAMRIEYEKLDTLLYTTALFVFTNRSNFGIFIGLPNEREHRTVISHHIDPIDKNSADLVFATMYQQVAGQASGLRNTPQKRAGFVSSESQAAFLGTRKRLSKLEELRGTSNALVIARLEGLSLSKLADDFSYICDRLEANS